MSKQLVKSLASSSSALPVLFGSALLAAANISHAADATAGKTAAQACAACHGINGVSISPAIPNLAAQKKNT